MILLDATKTMSLAVCGGVTAASLLILSFNSLAFRAHAGSSFVSESSIVSGVKRDYGLESTRLSQLSGYGDSPRCAREKLALAKEISSRNLWFEWIQGKEKSEYNPYPGSYFFAVKMLPGRGEWNYPLSSEETSKVYAFMRDRAESLSISIIKSCSNISSVHFPIPHTGYTNAFYRHDLDMVKPFQCLGQVAPSGWGFGPCT